MPLNKVVARFQDGRVVKGHTGDFLPTRPGFHLELEGAPRGAKPAAITLAELKAVFFVKDMKGDPTRTDVLEFHPGRPAVGRKVRVVFKDGETIVGTTQGYDPKRAGFFVVPASDGSNNERCFVVIAATKEISFL